ncbi:cell division protein FtsX [Viscerimonas tarda]
MAKNRQGGSSSLWGAGMTTAVSITLVLLLLGLTILVGFFGKRITSLVKENIAITVEISDTMKGADIAKLQNQLQNKPFTKEVKFVSKEEIKKQLITDLGKDPEEILGYNPASSCFDINLKAEYANPDSMKVVEAILKGEKVVKNIIYSQDDLEMVNSNLSKIGTALLAMALVLLFISFTLIRNTIRLNIYSKRFIINTMQLVGATDSFIRRPFVQGTVFMGVVAAIIADMLITILVYSSIKEYPEMISIIQISDLLIIYAAVLAFGILLTWLATRSAVNKYLKMKTNNLYYI